MTMEDQRQIETTRDKLRLLEQTYEQVESRSTGTAYTRELTQRSLKGLINQLKEEIAHHEAHAGAPTRTR
jgi:hypothetical protein